MRNKKVQYLVQAAMIAAIYVVLTQIANLLGLANHAIQVRFSEALTILPFFTPAAIPGLFVGCILSNYLTGAIVWDILFGSLATLAAAVLTYVIGRNQKHSPKFTPWLAPIPPIAVNTIIIPFVLHYAYRFPGGIPYFMVTVGIGELVSCGVLGMLLYFSLNKHRDTLFPSPARNY